MGDVPIPSRAVSLWWEGLQWSPDVAKLSKVIKRKKSMVCGVFHFSRAVNSLKIICEKLTTKNIAEFNGDFRICS